MMWSAILSFLLSVVKWIWGGSQQVEGEAQGKAEQQAVDTNQELKNVQAADDARNSVSDDPSDIVSDSSNSGPTGG